MRLLTHRNQHRPAQSCPRDFVVRNGNFTNSFETVLPDRCRRVDRPKSDITIFVDHDIYRPRCISTTINIDHDAYRRAHPAVRGTTVVQRSQLVRHTVLACCMRHHERYDVSMHVATMLVLAPNVDAQVPSDHAHFAHVGARRTPRSVCSWPCGRGKRTRRPSAWAATYWESSATSLPSRWGAKPSPPFVRIVPPIFDHCASCHDGEVCADCSRLLSLGIRCLNRDHGVSTQQEGMSGQDQFEALHRHFPSVSTACKALLLSTYVKLANLYPECQELVTPVRIFVSVCLNLPDCWTKIVSS